MRWKKKSKIVKMMWNILYKNNGNVLPVVRKILWPKILVSELNKINSRLYKIMLFVVRKNKGSLKIKKQADYWENLGSQLH